ncbi:hypothetical protein C8R43DRAFT_952086 [Mycena crocata]|nr:hypothetical protein C8R43DRAFT_952086 [Mycena crocata]
MEKSRFRSPQRDAELQGPTAYYVRRHGAAVQRSSLMPSQLDQCTYYSDSDRTLDAKWAAQNWIGHGCWRRPKGTYIAPLSPSLNRLPQGRRYVYVRGPFFKCQAGRSGCYFAHCRDARQFMRRDPAAPLVTLYMFLSRVREILHNSPRASGSSTFLSRTSEDLSLVFYFISLFFLSLAARSRSGRGMAGGGVVRLSRALASASAIQRARRNAFPPCATKIILRPRQHIASAAPRAIGSW